MSPMHATEKRAARPGKRRQATELLRVLRAVRQGDFSARMPRQRDAVMNGIAESFNGMVEQLSSFASEINRVAKEVGTEGKLGAQASVKGVSGTWKDLTDNVNQLAGNLTAQVRAIAEVATAIANGDLSRSITSDAQGEVAALKDNINQMIVNLKETIQKNHEQDWLKTNLAKFSGMMQGQRSIAAVAQLIMSELTPLVGAHHGTFFMTDCHCEDPTYHLAASYAFSERKNLSNRYRLKEGLIGQCAFEKKLILLTNVPSDYVRISSSLGEAKPLNIVVLPAIFEGEVKAVIELASFQEFSPIHLSFLEQFMDSIGVVLNMIVSSSRTEELLQELKRSNAELESKAKLLEVKNQEVELARGALEEKAEQLQLISKYKSEFLANMSHELRTPLNSLLILSRMLGENKDGNLTADQVRFANTIFTSGNDLLTLINEILDLSKVEAGKMPVEVTEAALGDLREAVERSFRPVAQHRGLAFAVDLDPQLPKAIRTDVNRLNQILRNLLSNAFKFTEHGTVGLRVRRAEPGRRFELDTLADAGNVIAFEVHDTGIGIPREKQKLIFDAFQQADGTTNRRYGGTGLGLTISREIARLLGGFISVESAPGSGSVFTLYLPARYAGSPGVPERQAEDPLTLPTPIRGDRDLSGAKVLVVDDDMRNVFAITAALEASGMSVLHAENGKEGLALLERNPDTQLVLMDVMMPQMDGIEATQLIRKDPRFKSLPIVCLTAKAMQGDREKCLGAGASDYITKPITPERLMALVGAWLPGTKDQARHKPRPDLEEAIA